MARPGGDPMSLMRVTGPDGGELTELARATHRARAPELRTIRALEQVLFFSS